MPLASKRARHVLFLCTGNSARSILAESVLQHRGRGQFQAHSAGSQPTGQVNPIALEVLEEAGYPHLGFESKSWDTFASPETPRLDFIFTVCDRAAHESCPLWPGQPVTIHWGLPDPAAATGSGDAKRDAFRKTLQQLEIRIQSFLDLARSSDQSSDWKRKLQEIDFPVTD